MKPKISMVMTTMDPDQDKITRSLESAVGFDEVIIHVDVATKNRPHMNFAGHEEWKEIGHPKHLEVGEAYDLLVKEAKGDWICCFFDDDYFDEGNLLKLLDYIRTEDPKEDIIHFPCHVCGIQPYHVWGASRVDVTGLEQANMLPAASFFRKSVWEAVGGFKGTLAHDWIFWLSAAYKGFKFEFFNAPVYWYEIRNGSAWFRQLEKEGKNNQDIVRKKVIGYAKQN